MPRIRATVVLVAALGAVGCSTTAALPGPKPTTTITPAAATASPGDVEGMVTAASRLGDLQTLDPCSLVDQAALPADLKATPAPRDSLDSCEFAIKAGGSNAQLSIGQLAVNWPVTAGTDQSLSRGLDLYADGLQPGMCDSALELGDSVYVISRATVASGDGSAALCDAAKAAGTDVANVLLGNAPLHHFSVPSDSLAMLNACDMLDGQRVQGFTLPQPLLGEPPAGHTCDWTPLDANPNGASLPDYELQFLVGPPPTTNQGGTSTTIGGKQTVKVSAQDAGGKSLCALSLVGRPFDQASNLMELAQVSVAEPSGQADTACSLATSMAQLAWPKLPPLS